MRLPATATTTTTAATATTAIATTTAASTSTATGLVLRLIDLEGATTHIVAVEGLDCAFCVGLWHFNEGKAARATRLAIHDQGD